MQDHIGDSVVVEVACSQWCVGLTGQVDTAQNIAVIQVYHRYILPANRQQLILKHQPNIKLYKPEILDGGKNGLTH